MAKFKTKAIIIATLFTATVLLAAIPIASPQIKITFLDVGYGEAVHIEYANQNILVTNATDSAAYNVNSYSERNGIKYDMMVLTECSKSHYDGALSILKTGDVAGEFVYTDVSDDIAESCRDMGIVMHEAQKYDTLIDNSGFEMTVMQCDYHAITLLLVYKGQNICLLSAHSAKRSEDNHAVAPVLRVSGEGGEHSINQSLIEAVRPAYAVISVYDNPYGLPDSHTLDLLRDYGIKVYRTDQNYSIIMTVDQNNTIKMRPMNED